MSRASVLAMEVERVFFDSCAEAVVSRSGSKRHTTSRRSSEGTGQRAACAGNISADIVVSWVLLVTYRHIPSSS